MLHMRNACFKVADVVGLKYKMPPFVVAMRFHSSNQDGGNAKFEKKSGSKKEVSSSNENKTSPGILPVEGVPQDNTYISEEVQKGDTIKTAENGGQTDTTAESRSKKHLIVPRVPSTDYIPAPEVQTEGLFAGYRPLFLGNSTFRGEKRSNALDNFFTSFANLKVVEESKRSDEVNVQDIIEDLKRDTQDTLQNSKGKNRKPIIPWDASISGMVYNDESFKNVPRNVVSRLKPFKMVRVEKKSQQKNTSGRTTNMIKMKVHNSKVTDETEMINLFSVCATRKSAQTWNHHYSAASKESALNARKNYERVMKNYAHRHKFIKSDQRVFKTDVDKLNRLLAKEFHKQTNLSLNTVFGENFLPLYIYVDKSISSRRLFRQFLNKKIMEHINPVLSTILSSYEGKDQAEKFQAKIKLKIRNIVRELSEYLPSVYFTGESVDCILHPGPIASFKRIHWLKPNKRRCIFWGKNIDMDYVFNTNGDYNVTRSGLKYMRYPVNLNWKTFDAAFSEWDYFA